MVDVPGVAARPWTLLKRSAASVRSNNGLRGIGPRRNGKKVFSLKVGIGNGRRSDCTNHSGCSATQRESIPVWLGTMSLARRMPLFQARCLSCSRAAQPPRFQATSYSCREYADASASGFPHSSLIRFEARDRSQIPISHSPVIPRFARRSSSSSGTASRVRISHYTSGKADPARPGRSLR